MKASNIELKIKKLELQNFGKFNNFEVEFGDKTTKLIGLNGAGKTTIGINAIWAGIKGIAERTKDGMLGERFRFIGGNKATSDIKITLEDKKHGLEIVVHNHISKDTNNIQFECTKGVLPDDWLGDFLNVAFLSAKNFCQLDGKNQALLLGINTAKFDQDLAELKEKYTTINANVRSYGDLVPVAEVEQVNLSELIGKRDNAIEHNNLQNSRQDAIDVNNRDINLLEKQLAEIQEELKTLKAKDLNKPSELIDIEPITAQISGAEETNQQALAYNNYKIKQQELDQYTQQLKSNKDEQEKVVNKRLKYIKNFKFGFDDLGVDEKGNLTLQDKPIKEPYFSKGELELIVANLYAAQNPIFKTRFIDDFELLDQNNQAKILDKLLAQGFQVITAEVGDAPKGKNSILLRECRVVGDSATTGNTIL